MLLPHRLLPFRCFLVGLALIQSSRAGSSVCYYPDGSEAKDYVYVPCNGTGVGSCCIPSEGDVCLSDGLCYYTSSPYVYRGACTDQTWKSSSCPQYCRSRMLTSLPLIIAEYQHIDKFERQSTRTPTKNLSTAAELSIAVKAILTAARSRISFSISAFLRW